MKKILSIFIIAIVATISAFAGDDVRIMQGSIAALKDGGTASVCINMQNTKFDNKMPLRQDSRYANVDNDIPEYQREFVREFNDHSKALRMQNESGADYTFLLEVDNLDNHITPFSFKGGVATVIWGTLTIKDRAGNIVAVLSISEFESSGINYNVSLEETFEVFAKKLAKRINKGK